MKVNVNKKRAKEIRFGCFVKYNKCDNNNSNILWDSQFGILTQGATTKENIAFVVITEHNSYIVEIPRETILEYYPNATINLYKGE